MIATTKHPERLCPDGATLTTDTNGRTFVERSRRTHLKPQYRSCSHAAFLKKCPSLELLCQDGTGTGCQAHFGKGGKKKKKKRESPHCLPKLNFFHHITPCQHFSQQLVTTFVPTWTFPQNDDMLPCFAGELDISEEGVGVSPQEDVGLHSNSSDGGKLLFHQAKSTHHVKTWRKRR